MKTTTQIKSVTDSKVAPVSVTSTLKQALTHEKFWPDNNSEFITDPNKKIWFHYDKNFIYVINPNDRTIEKIITIEPTNEIHIKCLKLLPNGNIFCGYTTWNNPNQTFIIIEFDTKTYQEIQNSKVTIPAPDNRSDFEDAAVIDDLHYALLFTDRIFIWNKSKTNFDQSFLTYSSDDEPTNFFDLYNKIHVYSKKWLFVEEKGMISLINLETSQHMRAFSGKKIRITPDKHIWVNDDDGITLYRLVEDKNNDKLVLIKKISHDGYSRFLPLPKKNLLANYFDDDTESHIILKNLSSGEIVKQINCMSGGIFLYATEDDLNYIISDVCSGTINLSSLPQVKFDLSEQKGMEEYIIPKIGKLSSKIFDHKREIKTLAIGKEHKKLSEQQRFYGIISKLIVDNDKAMSAELAIDLASDKLIITIFMDNDTKLKEPFVIQYVNEESSYIICHLKSKSHDDCFFLFSGDTLKLLDTVVIDSDVWYCIISGNRFLVASEGVIYSWTIEDNKLSYYQKILLRPVTHPEVSDTILEKIVKIVPYADGKKFIACGRKSMFCRRKISTFYLLSLEQQNQLQYKGKIVIDNLGHYERPVVLKDNIHCIFVRGFEEIAVWNLETKSFVEKFKISIPDLKNSEHITFYRLSQFSHDQIALIFEKDNQTIAYLIPQNQFPGLQEFFNQALTIINDCVNPNLSMIRSLVTQIIGSYLEFIPSPKELENHHYKEDVDKPSSPQTSNRFFASTASTDNRTVIEQRTNKESHFKITLL